jgi:hypothetical protein
MEKKKVASYVVGVVVGLVVNYIIMASMLGEWSIIQWDELYRDLFEWTSIIFLGLMMIAAKK